MNAIRGTPAYWKNYLYEVLALYSNIFMTLSYTVFRENKLSLIICMLGSLDFSVEDI